ncbi:MAG TPA: glycosyltransferase family 39 protein [Thermoanaerobaculia bacterium]|nr:glycosyltransferase family 39 protein [Thermoanaerobaculia bacterium]
MAPNSPAQTHTLSPVPRTTPQAPLRPLAIGESGLAAVPAGWTAWLSRALTLAVLFITAEALFSVPKLTWDLATGGAGRAGLAVGAVVAAIAMALLWAGRHRIAALLQAAGGRLAAIPRRRWLASVIVAGIAARIVWMLLFPAPFTSDGRSYYQLAAKLAEGQGYQTPKGELAAWPPGYPFILLAHFKLFGVGLAAVTAANLLLFAGTILVVFPLARRFGEGTARLATLLVALWPNLIASAGVASKEMVIVFLLPATLLLYLRAAERSGGSAAAMRFAAGLVLGYATLTQPGLMLIVGAFLIHEVLLRTPLLQGAGRLALLAVGMALVILPWTWRNQRVLGTPVLVSTNGGSVFYRANNPLATGGWIQHGERRLTGDELTQDRLGYQWGKEWIRENPGQFLLLSLRKQILFLGDDATGLYELKRGGQVGGGFYALLKLITNAWWWGIWGLVLVAFLVRRATSWDRRADVVLFLLTILYFWAIDSVFESGARHHMPLIGVLAILAASAALPRLSAKNAKTPAM